MKTEIGKLPPMKPEAAQIASEMIVHVDGVRVKASYIAIERYEEGGMQWVRLVAEKDGQYTTYLIDRKKFVDAWIHLVKSVTKLEGMIVKVDDVRWQPLDTGIVDVDDIKSVFLEIKSPEGIEREITIDFVGIVKAYHNLIHNINDFFADLADITESIINLGDG